MSIEEAISGSIASSVKTLDGVASIIMAHIEAADESLPFVMVPNFDKFVQPCISDTVPVIAFAPVVVNITAWNFYSEEHMGYSSQGFPLSVDLAGSLIQQATAEGNHSAVVPIWQMSPSWIAEASANISLSTFGLESSNINQVANEVLESAQPGLGRLDATMSKEGNNTVGNPFSVESSLMKPIAGSSALLLARMAWPPILRSRLRDGQDIQIVIKNSCSQTVTLDLDREGKVFVIHDGDTHENEFEKYGISFGVSQQASLSGCKYQFSVFPQRSFWDAHDTNIPFGFAMLIGCMAVLSAIAFYTYDNVIQGVTNSVIGMAARSNALVASIFPAAVRKRLLRPGDEALRRAGASALSQLALGQQGLQNFLEGDDQHCSDPTKIKGRPIAEIFPEATVMVRHWQPCRPFLTSLP